MATFITTQNVTIWDLSIKLYGDTSNVVRIVKENPALISITSLISPGTAIEYTAPNGNTIVDHFNRKKITPTTGTNDPTQGKGFDEGFTLNGFN